MLETILYLLIVCKLQWGLHQHWVLKCTVCNQFLPFCYHILEL
ncbi:hypothetical protein KC19_5G183200 [Ceratodon purpureus]|uniref:Uncharacterized protein n=1 Tax=Ceratodon purpureus TaxID=3225 RepID=A0A8T0I2Y5_CERPU|nr:hypothetical protein KC19_5G183200 [Ceratodon purpureus]